MYRFSNQISFITGQTDASQLNADLDLQSTYSVINAPQQTSIDDHTLISKQYADDNYKSITASSNAITADDASDSITCNDGGTITVVASNEIDFTIDSIDVASFKQNNNGLQISTPTMNIQLDSATNQKCTVYGQDDTQDTTLVIQASVADSVTNRLASLNMELNGGLNNQMIIGGGQYDIGSGVVPVNFIQGGFQGDALTIYSSGPALSSNQISMEGDTYSGLTSLPTKFSRKTGYDTGIAITENSQFTTKLYVDDAVAAGSSLSLAQIAAANPSAASITASSQKITNLGNATTGTDALNRTTADARYYQSTVPLNSITLATGIVDVNSHIVRNVSNPILNGDAVNLSYANSNYLSSNQSLAQIATANASASSITASSQKITNLANATATTDAANYSQIHSGTSAVNVLQDVPTTPNNSITTGTSNTQIKVSGSTNNLVLQSNAGSFPNISCVGGVEVSGNGTSQIYARSTGAVDLISTNNDINLTCQTNTQHVNIGTGSGTLLAVGGSGTAAIQAGTNIDMLSANKVINAVDPTNPQDYVTKAYGDANYTSGGGGSSQSSIIYPTTGTVQSSVSCTGSGVSMVIPSVTNALTIQQDSVYCQLKCNDGIEVSSNTAYLYMQNAGPIVVQQTSTQPTYIVSGSNSNIKICDQLTSTVIASFGNASAPTPNILFNQSVSSGSNSISSSFVPNSANVLCNKTYVDSLVDGIPIGFICAGANSSAPSSKWLLCDGNTYNTTTYAALFAILGVNTTPPMSTNGRVLQSTIIGSSLGSTQNASVESHVHGSGTLVNASTTTVASTTGTGTSGGTATSVKYTDSAVFNSVGGSTNAVVSISSGGSSTGTNAAVSHTHTIPALTIPSLTVNTPAITGSTGSYGSTRTQASAYIVNYFIKAL